MSDDGFVDARGRLNWNSFTVNYDGSGGGLSMASRTERKLAAILAADVVGYSRLVGDDEAGTIARLRTLRKDLVEPLIAEYHGRVVKLMGDGALVEFASAVDAVECAVAVQQGVAEREAAATEDRRVQFRIGINIGDIIIEEGDILGNGVNVAARLEGLAEPGGICIARNVHNQVKMKLDLAFVPMGEHRVKNIAEPITVYRVDPDAPGRALDRRPVWAQRRWQAVAAGLVLLLALSAVGAWYGLWQSAPEAITTEEAVASAAAEKPTLPLPDKPSVAVLPFDNLSNEEHYERLTDGITEDIITDLSRFRDLFVIARNSTLVYKDKPTDVRQIARELGVRHVLEGSLQSDGKQVRVTAQLIDAISGNHLWSERYDRALELLVDNILASAVRPQPILAIGASLCALGALISRKYRTQTNLRTNLYVVGMAGSGGGKDHARSAIKEAFIAAGLQRYLGGNRIASGSGLLTALYRQPSSLFQLDEFGQFLGSKRHAPKYLTEIWDLLTEFYTSAGGTFFGAEYADQSQRPRQDIGQPCCCVHATTVPEPFWAALQQGSMVDGSLARFLVFQTDDDVPDRNRRPRPIGDVPDKLVQALQGIAAGIPGHGGGNIAALVEGPMVVPDPYPVPMTPEAERLFDALDEELTAHQREAVGTNRSAVLARVWENTAKVALIKAISANPPAPCDPARGRRLGPARGRSLRHYDDHRGRPPHRRQSDPGQPQEGPAVDSERRPCRLVPQRHYPTHAVPRAQIARGHPQRAGRGGRAQARNPGDRTSACGGVPGGGNLMPGVGSNSHCTDVSLGGGHMRAACANLAEAPH
jgi:TolB-like protein/class 3 adenylate cyclase